MNQFSKSEAELVNKIVEWVKTHRSADENHKKGMILHFACGWVRAYANPDDYDAAVDAVVELVGEKLNANT
jgi:hypothetical protein